MLRLDDWTALSNSISILNEILSLSRSSTKIPARVPTIRFKPRIKLNTLNKYFINDLRGQRREVHPPQGRFVHCLYLSPAIYQTFSSSWRVPIRKRGGSRRRDKGTYETDNAFSGASRNEETCPGGRQPAK